MKKYLKGIVATILVVATIVLADHFMTMADHEGYRLVTIYGAFEVNTELTLEELNELKGKDEDVKATYVVDDRAVYINMRDIIRVEER